MELVKQYKKEIDDLDKKKPSKQDDIVSDYRNRLEEANSVIDKQNDKISSLQKELNKEKMQNISKKDPKTRPPPTNNQDNELLSVLDQTLLFIVPEKPKFSEQIEKGLDERVHELYSSLEKYLNDDHPIFIMIVKILKRNLDECRSTLSCTFWLRQVMFLVDKVAEQVNSETIKDITSLLPNRVEITAGDEIYDLDNLTPILFLDYLKKLIVSFFFKIIQIIISDTHKLLFSCFFEKVADHKRKHVQQDLISDLTRYLNDFIKVLDEYNIEYIDIFQIINQVLYSYDCYLFNELLSSENFCTVAHGFNIKLNIAQLLDWKISALSNLYNNSNLISSVVSMDFISNASNVLIMDKAMFAEEDVRIALKPLQNRHIHRLLFLFSPDHENRDEVPEDVLSLIHDDYNLSQILLNDKVVRKIEL